MIHLDNRGRAANSQELAEFFHSMNIGERAKFVGETDEVIRTANSLSRTHKRHNKTRFSCHTDKNGNVTVTCIANRKPTTVIVI